VPLGQGTDIALSYINPTVSRKWIFKTAVT
jgi:hypothetical protein